MSNTKKINIYVGDVGRAYVDKETALFKLNAAQQNVGDVENIIETMDNSETGYFAVIGNILANAFDARRYAQTVIDDLNQKLANPVYDSVIHSQLEELMAELSENDNDNNFSNGGSTNTADANIAFIQSLETELNEIKTLAQQLLHENSEYLNQCQTAYDNAVDTFNAFFPATEEDHNDISDQKEQELIDRLNVVGEGLQIAQDTIDAINNTSDDIQARANEIVSAYVEPEEPVEPSNNTYFAGIGQLNQEFTENDFNMSGEKPTSIHWPAASRPNAQIFIYPTSWGTPEFIMDGEEYDPLQGDGFLTVPTGYTSVYATGPDCDLYITWN